MEDQQNSSQIPYDIIILGASGFTGKYVVREALKFLNSPSSPLKTLALAPSTQTHHHPPSPFSPPTPPTHLPSAVSLNCVGPFRLYGEPVVAACADSGCDYLDICGEPEFMERMEAIYHDKAVKKGSLVISACGFDSIPFS